QNPVRSRLHRQMQIIGQRRHLGIGLDETVGEFNRMGGGKANALNALDVVNIANQQGQIGGAAAVHGAAIGVDVLPQQIDFNHTLLGQPGNFCNHIVERTADLFSASVGNHAERAVLGAAF